MKRGEKSDAFANRIGPRKKQYKCCHAVENNTAFLSSYSITHEKHTRKSPPLLGKNQFANRGVLVYTLKTTIAENIAISTTRNRLFCYIWRNRGIILSKLAPLQRHCPTRGD